MSQPTASELGAIVEEEVGKRETAQEHVRNALAQLYVLPTILWTDGEGNAEEGYYLSPNTMAAVYRRLWHAVRQMEEAR